MGALRAGYGDGMAHGNPAQRTLALMRLGLGVSSILAPRVVGRVLGLDPDRNPAGPLIARLFGARNVAIGLRLRHASADERDYWLRASLAIDTFDGLAVVAARARGEVPTRTVVLGVTAALAAVGTGALARQR